MTPSLSRLVIAGLSGDSGKTIATLSFLAALKRKGLSVSAFKKGPDYIDPAWLSTAAGTPCRNLDTWMVERSDVQRSFVDHAAGSDIAVVEGNRGLFDGRDSAGTHSTAELAKLIDAPVVLVVSAVKVTRTVAALVKGCREFDPDVRIAGVVLNRVSGERHARIASEAIEEYCRVPVVGVIPRLGADSTLIPGRHLGLVTPAEFGDANEIRSKLADIADRHLDVDRMVSIAAGAGAAPQAPPRANAATRAARGAKVRVGYFSDSVFTFYYPENLEALEAQDAVLVPISSLSDQRLPRIDALYIGGGFPETHAERLAENRSMMASVREASEDGMPIYAECGGLIYLARSLRCGGTVHPMSGVFALDLEMHDRPVGHGYTSIEVDSANPFYKKGLRIRGHEFHYSGPVGDPSGSASCMSVDTGVGVGEGRDGLVWRNVLACYCHVHADGTKQWAPALVARAAEYAAEKNRGKSNHGGASIRSIAL